MKFFSFAIKILTILFLQYLFKGTCSEGQIFNFKVSKIILPTGGDSSSTLLFCFKRVGASPILDTNPIRTTGDPSFDSYSKVKLGSSRLGLGKNYQDL